MVQIIESNRRPSGSERFGNAFSGIVRQGVDFLHDKKARQEAAQYMQEENDAVKRLTGQDISGVNDPKQRQQIVSELLRGENERKKFQEQTSAKDQQFKSKVDYFSEKFGKGKVSQDSEMRQRKEEGFEPENDFDSSRISDEDVIEATMIDPILGRTLGDIKKADIKAKTEKEKAKQSKFESDRQYHSKTSDPILQKASDVIQSAPIKRGLNNQQRIDIQSGNTSGLIPYLVEKTGAEIWRNPESARFKTIAKESFIESLNSIGGGARPNQFIERQLSEAQPALGRSAEANLTILDMLEFKDDLIEKRAELIRDFAKIDRDELGYVKNDVAERADAKMASYAEKKQEALAYDIRQRKEANMNDQELAKEIALGAVTPGTPLTLRAASMLMIKNGDDPKKAQAEAKKLGFTIPSEETYMRGVK